MPVATHFKFVFRGEFISTPETWSFSLKYSRDNPAGADASYGDVSSSGVDSAIAAFIANSRFNTRVRCTDWRLYQIGSDGLTEGNPTIREFLTAEMPTGTGNAVLFPPDVALCVTTEAENRGHARFGRFYLPGPNVALGTDLRLSAVDAQDWADHTVTFVKAVSDQIDLEGLQSSEMLNISNDAAATRQTVRNLRVGRVYDRISRRRRQMVEDYVSTGTIDW